VDQDYLNYYFGNVWHQGSNPIETSEKSGKALIEKINSGERVIDIGCGTNPFKGLIPNLVGIDPAFDQADYRVTVEDFETTEKFDVAFCLGSINFGNRGEIEKQISKVVSLLKPDARIYWRCNPGQQDHPSDECKNIQFYPWTIPEHVRLAEKFGFRLMQCQWENNNRRLYAEWVR
jgi:hypothetical protein